jgi:hypothetical protein
MHWPMVDQESQSLSGLQEASWTTQRGQFRYRWHGHRKSDSTKHNLIISGRGQCCWSGQFHNFAILQSGQRSIATKCSTGKFVEKLTIKKNWKFSASRLPQAAVTIFHILKIRFPHFNNNKQLQVRQERRMHSSGPPIFSIWAIYSSVRTGQSIFINNR